MSFTALNARLLAKYGGDVVISRVTEGPEPENPWDPPSEPVTISETLRFIATGADTELVAATVMLADDLVGVLAVPETLDEPKVLDTLFAIFNQADRGCVLLQDAESGELRGLLRRRGAVGVPAVGALSFVAAVVGTICAAMGFVLEYALGGAATTSLGTVGTYMFGTHVLIGIGEGIITALTVMAVVRARPDLVYLLRTNPAKMEASV